MNVLGELDMSVLLACDFQSFCVMSHLAVCRDCIMQAGYSLSRFGALNDFLIWPSEPTGGRAP
jgi:hypothetical protein